jgi:hypothetical protein
MGVIPASGSFVDFFGCVMWGGQFCPQAGFQAGLRRAKLAYRHDEWIPIRFRKKCVRFSIGHAKCRRICSSSARSLSSLSASCFVSRRFRCFMQGLFQYLKNRPVLRPSGCPLAPDDVGQTRHQEFITAQVNPRSAAA